MVAATVQPTPHESVFGPGPDISSIVMFPYFDTPVSFDGMTREATLSIHSAKIGSENSVFACDDRNERPRKSQGVL
jgi:hypothetical protein